MAALLEVEDVVRAGQPDQLSVITYLAQLYHRLQGEGEGGVVRRTRRRPGRRKGAIQSLMSCQASRPVSWHGGDISRQPATPVERENPFTEAHLLNSVQELALTNSNKPSVVQMRKLKKPQFSNYSSHHSQTKENSSCPSSSSPSSSSSSSSSSTSPATRRGRPTSYIGISDSPRPWAPHYSRNGDPILTSPSLLGGDWSDSREHLTGDFQINFNSN